MNTQLLTRPTILALAILTCASLSSAELAQPTTPKRKTVEVVFVLDTTSSMTGLIQAAKEKIWSIANSLSQAEPSPLVRTGLVAYRDRRDSYVTQVTPLNDDLDAVYSVLMGLDANGGGDGPESVNQALYDAVHKIPWSSDHETYRVIFLVGDAPPHMDYQDDVKYQQTLREAAAKGVIVNTIQCGNESDTTPIWRDIALHGEGQFFQVEQSGSAILAATPFDTELAQLSRNLEGTRLYYGDADDRVEQHAKVSVGREIDRNAPAMALAGRAAWNATNADKASFLGKQELVSAVSSGAVVLDKLSEAELPTELQALPKKDRGALLEKNELARKDIVSKIQEVSKKRQQYLEDQSKKQGTTKESLDWKLFQAVKVQAAAKGIAYGDGPSL